MIFINDLSLRFVDTAIGAYNPPLNNIIETISFNYITDKLLIFGIVVLT